MIHDALNAGETDDREQRTRWAKALRAPIAKHPMAHAFVDDDTPVCVCCANRRGGKTENPGREALARCVERDGYVVWVVASDLAEYSRNWLQRKPVGGVQLLRDIGMGEGTAARAKDFRVGRGSQGATVEIEFPRWGSILRVWSSKDEHQIERIRGGQFDLLICDEAQKQHLLGPVILEITGPASADRDAEIWLLGTPGADVDSLFAQASRGAFSRWASHAWYSWDNPYFGVTFDKRYRRAVWEPIFKTGELLGLSPEQWEFLHPSNMTEDIARNVLDHPVGKTLPAILIREYFGQWLVDQEGLVFGSVPAVQPYWAEFSDDIDRRHRGDGTLDDLLNEPDAWPDRIAQLPMHAWSTPTTKSWRGLVGVDLGYHPDPFALVALVFSPHDQALYELGSGKALRLGEDEQRAALEQWVERLAALGVQVRASIVDSSGGASTSQQVSWSARLQERFGVPVFPAEKFSTAKYAQIWMMNQDIRRGSFRLLRNSPLDVEMRALQWKFSASGRREIHKTRTSSMPDGSQATLGDHCADAARYTWFWSEHVRGRVLEESPDPASPAARQAEMDAQDLRAGARNRRRRRR